MKHRLPNSLRFRSIRPPGHASFPFWMCVSPGVPLVAAAALGLAPLSHATPYTWDPDGVIQLPTNLYGGSGVWNTTSSCWWNTGNAAWINTGSNDALLGSTPGTITVAVPQIKVQTIYFQVDGYSIVNGGVAENTLLVGASVDTSPATTTGTMGVVLAGTNGFTKSGLGTVLLNGASVNTYTGTTTVSGGTLALDFTNLSVPTNLIDGTSPLVLNGTNLTIKANASGTTSQTFASLTANAGNSRLLGNPNGGSGLILDLGTLVTTAAGSSLLVGQTNGTTGGPVSLSTGSAPDVGGIYSGRVVLGSGTADTGYDWPSTASISPSYTLAPLAVYTDLTADGSTDGANTRLVSSLSLAGPHTHHSLKIENPVAGQSLDLGGNVLTLSSGGLLLTGTQAFTISGSGAITAGNTSGSYDLIIHQFNSGGATLSGVVGNNGANAVAFVKAGSGQLTISATNTYTGGTFVNDGILRVTGTGAALQGTTKVGGGSTLWMDVAGAGNVTFTHTLTGTGTIKVTAAGTGTITDIFSGVLSGFTGTWDLLPNSGGGGKINFSNATQANTPPSSATIKLESGATLYLNQALTYASKFQLFGGTTGETLGQLRIESSTISGAVTLMGNTTIGANSGTGTISGAIGESGGSFGFTKLGAGTTILTGGNSYTGTTTITGGTLQIGNGASGQFGSGSVVNNAALIFNRTSTLTSAGAISGTGTVTKSGTGTVILSGAGSWSGLTNVYNGTLQLQSNQTGLTGNVQVGGPSAAGNSTFQIAAGATFGLAAGKQINLGNTGSGTVNGQMTVDGSVTNAGTLTLGRAGLLTITNGGSMTQSGAMNLQSNGGYGNSLTVNSGGSFTYSGTGSISLNAAAGTNASGSATLTIAGGSFTTGQGFTQSGGTGTSGQIPNGNILINGGGILKLSADIPALTTITPGGGSFPGTGTFQLGTGGGVINTQSFSATMSGAITNVSAQSGSLTKTGGGTLTLAGANTYTGDTTVSAGTLSVSSAYFANAAAVRVATGATLNLNHAATDVIDKFYIDGVLQAAGTWGAIGSSAAHQTSLITGTGILQASNGASAYELWATAKGLTTGVKAAKSDNPDNDGCNNLAEFALDGTPLSGTSDGKVALRQTVDGPTMTLPVRKNAGAFIADSDGLLSPLVDGVRYRIQASNDLVSWNLIVIETAPDTTGLPILSDTAAWEYRTFQIAPGNPKAFLRAKVTDTP